MTSARVRKSFLPITKTLLSRQFCFSVSNNLHSIRTVKMMNFSYLRLLGFVDSESKNYRTVFGREIWNTRDFSSAINYEKTSTENISTNENSAEKLADQLTYDRKFKHRVYENDLLRLISKIDEGRFVTPQQALLMISCCSSLLPDVTPEERIKLLNKVWKTLKNYVTFDISHYNELLRCYKENSHSFVARKFVENMSPVKPNAMTYQLLLAAVCEISHRDEAILIWKTCLESLFLGHSQGLRPAVRLALVITLHTRVGDMNQASEIISNMKSNQIRLTDIAMNSLIEGQGKASSSINGVKDVLETMKSLKITPTAGTQVALIKVSIWNNRLDDLQKYISDVRKNAVVFSVNQIMDIVKCLAIKNLNNYIQEVMEFLTLADFKNSETVPYLYSICVQLINEGYPEAAYIIYNTISSQTLGSRDDKTTYCRRFLKECVKSSLSFEVIKKIVMDLIETKQNIFALQVSCEAALYYGKAELACDLLRLLKDLGYPVRCHFFWPLLVQASKSSGEKGIFDVLSFMKSLEIMPDHETLLEYILPYINIASPAMLMKKFKTYGITGSSSLIPILCLLLKQGKLGEVCDICNDFQGNLDLEVLILPLVQCYIHTEDVDSLLRILDIFSQRSSNMKKDWVGVFLVTLASKQWKWKNGVKNFELILKKMSRTKLGISTSAIDICIQHVETFNVSREDKEQYKKLLVNMNSDLSNDDTNLSSQHIPHPRFMNIDQLGAHLVELESKNMNTRGVLRRLLQEHCRQGNMKEAKKIIAKCDSQNIQFSPGMIASVMDLYVRCNDLHKAEICLSKLHNAAPNFVLDEHKMIDYATLLIRNKKAKYAATVLEEYAVKCSRIKGGKSLETNCWRLLDALSESSGVNETERMMALLTRLGFCRISNILLGPLIRSYLNRSDEEGAVEKFVECGTKYKMTPLRHELLCRLLVRSHDPLTPTDAKTIEDNVKEKYQKLLSQVLEVDRKIHGVNSSETAFICALAEMGLKRQLRRYVLDPTVTVNPESLMKQCQRLGEENKLTALQIIAESMEGIRNICVDDLYEIILKVHSFNSDCDASVDLWNKMQEKNIKPSKKFVEVFSGLLKSNRRDIPSDLIAYLDAETKTSVLGS